MTIEIRNITATAVSNTYRLLLEVNKSPHLFVVEIQREPVFGISAPHSFWMLCAEHDLAAHEILDFVRRIDAGDSVEWPALMKAAEPPKPMRDTALWATHSGYHLPEGSLRRAAAYFSRRADTSLFPRAFEYSLISEYWDDLAPVAKRIDLLSHRIEGFRQLVAPKASAGTRIATQLDPLDTIILTACVYELGDALETARVPVEEAVVHSFRFAGTEEELWHHQYGYPSFLARTRQLLEHQHTSFVVETDISSFYHRVPIDVAVHALERAGAERKLLEGVRRMVLSFSNVGLPVGPVPVAFFAEAVLNEVDMALLSAGATFVRYNDDYRFFCKTEGEARARLQTLADLLWRTAELTLQDTKTQIFDADDYQRRIAPKDTWLGDLKRHILAHDPAYGDPDPQQLDVHDHRLLESARDVLTQAISKQHVAWIRICRLALDALPLRDRFDMLPALIEQFARLKPIARDISRCLALCGQRRPDDRTELIEDVVRSVLKDEVPDGPDFGRAWLTRSFVSTDWPALKGLLSICSRWPGDSASKREILLALRNEPSLAREVEFDPTDPWQRRAALSTLGSPASNGRRIESEEQRWSALLEGVITSSDLGGDPFTEH